MTGSYPEPGPGREANWIEAVRPTREGVKDREGRSTTTTDFGLRPMPRPNCWHLREDRALTSSSVSTTCLDAQRLPDHRRADAVDAVHRPITTETGTRVPAWTPDSSAANALLMALPLWPVDRMGSRQGSPRTHRLNHYVGLYPSTLTICIKRLRPATRPRVHGPDHRIPHIYCYQTDR